MEGGRECKVYVTLDCEKNGVNAGGVKSNVTLRCSRLLPWGAVVKQVEDFVLRMRFSGYTKKFRYEVVDSALKAYRTIEDDDRSGERPMYRPKDWKRKEREKEKIKTKVTCHEKDGSESVIFVPATPGSQLQKQYEQQIRSERFRVRVVEKAGESLKGDITKI